MSDKQLPLPRNSHRFIVFGEVLFDCFPDGSAVLGGAPFNVAWNMQGLGADPLLISRIGTDQEGRKVEQAMNDWGMDITGLQKDEEHPSGRVEVSIESGQPHFEIVPDQAYDHIDPDDARTAVGDITPHMIYHGSLIRRADSKTALETLIRLTGAPVFLDINLRAPWWHTEDVIHSIEGARWLKINDEELHALRGTLGLPETNLEDMATALRRKFNLETAIVTCGSKGAFAVDHQENLYRQPVTPVPQLIDTVGAGDAFSAMSMLGLAAGWPVPEILEQAQHFAAGICGIRGATSRKQELYQWQ